MDEPINPNREQPTAPDDILCANCQINKIEEGHATKLCSDCRKTFINFPIPKWIKFFALGIGAVIIISLIRTKAYIDVAFHLGRGENAIEQKRFVTAQRELGLVLKKFPNDLTANADMIIAASYNLDFDTADSCYEKVKDRDADDEDLVKRTSEALGYLTQNDSKDTAMIRKIKIAEHDHVQLLKLGQQLDTVQDAALKAFVANYLFDFKDYTTAEHLVRSALKEQPGYGGAFRLMASIDRETGKYDEGLAYCDSLLYINKEDIYAIAQKAKINLKKKNDTQAANCAREAMDIDSTQDLALEAMAMVNYYAGHTKQSQIELAKVKALASKTRDSVVYNRLAPIINGSVKFR